MAGRVIIPRNMNALLEVRDLEVSYRRSEDARITALQDVSFTLNPGETLGVIGESGSGKSTLAVSLLSLLPENGMVQNGRILLQDRDVLKLDSIELRKLRGERIALIFQEPSLALHPTMRIRDQVAEILRAHLSLNSKQRRQRADEILAEVFGTDAFGISSSYAHQLSGGQRQRAVIAQAIACRPSVIIADEPTASLDTVTQQGILLLFQKLRTELQLTLIFITHNPALLKGFADRILVLYAGNAVELGRTADVLASPLHPYTKLLLACSPTVNPEQCHSPAVKLPVISGEAPNLSKRVQGCCFAPRCPEKMKVCEERAPFSIEHRAAHNVSCFLHDG
jgi:oligopeptide/dipeptide ABC transporter ATP-binding protein